MYGRMVLLGVSGCIAAYKACEIISRLKKLGADVNVIMTENAGEFVRPLTFESLSGNEVITDMFLRKKEWEIEHVSLARKASVMVIAPATANVIGKLASGIADDMLTTTFMACKAPKIICPAMNTAMYEDAQLTENIAKLKARGVIFIEPIEGRLACGDIGKGKLAEPEAIVAKIVEAAIERNDYSGKTVLVTAGATRENIDGVRFISNYSSGKMGLAIAEAALRRGAKVILISGALSVPVPKGIYKQVNVVSTEDMFKAVMDNLPEADIIIKAAAPADYTVKPYKNKVKSDALTLELTKTTDIAKKVGEVKGNKKLIIFSAETENLIENACGKLNKKHADMVVANDVTKEGAGFNTDTNIAVLITNSGETYETGKILKSELAGIILDRALTL